MPDSEEQLYEPSREEKQQGNTVRGKIIDMMVYALPILERWSVAHQKLLGDKMADAMEEMLLYANKVEWAPNKKTPLRELDYLNKWLHDMVQVAYDSKYLKGPSTLHEWQRRCDEIGKMIGGFEAAIYGKKSPKETVTYRRTTHGRRG